MRIHSFNPIINDNCTIMILGSVPGVESLKRMEYYGHPQNKFWTVIYAVFGKLPDSDYKKKKDFLLKHGIALWDVIESCERHGSLDSKIRNVKYNDFASFFKKHPSIRHIFFNGRKAQHLFEKNFYFPGIKLTYLGSTSPAHAVTIEQRLSEWALVIEEI